MNYASQADMEQRFGVQALLVAGDRDGDGVVDADLVARALSDASAEIDSYLSGRYALPLATVPPLLARVCCDMAFYFMSSDSATQTEEKRQRLEDARALLKLVSEGKVRLGLAAAAEAAAAPGPMLVTPGRADFARFRP